MLKMLRYLKHIKWEILSVLLLLGVQAWCDLSLPQYTSDIVDIGIQQGGIEHMTPEFLREETMDTLLLLLSEEDGDALRAAYSAKEKGVLALNTHEKEELARLDDLLTPPLLILAHLGETGENTPAALRAALSSGKVSGETLLAEAEAALDGLGEGAEPMLLQKTLPFLKAEYQAAGIAPSHIQTRYLLREGGKMLIISLLMALAAVAVGFFAARSSAKIGYILRQDVFAKAVSFSSKEMNRFSTASLITRSTNDIQQMQMVVGMMLRVVLYAPIIGIGGIIMVGRTNTHMSWIIAVAVGSSLALVALLMCAALPRFKSMQKLVDRLNLVSRETLTGVSVIRAFSREEHEEERFDKASRDLMKTQLFTNRVMNVMMPAMSFIMGVVSVLIVYFGGRNIDAGVMQVGDLIAFITYTMQIVMAFLMIAMVSIMLPRAGVAAARVNEVLSTVPAIRDPEEPKDDALENVEGILRFEDVSFRFPDADEDALSHLTFTARPGTTTAIIGSTGSGKSTVLSLVPRFFDVTGGRITIDGVDIREMSQKKLRSLLGYVPQQGVLFSGTIGSNLRFGGEFISEEEMRTAARIAQAEDFILEKPEGYQSPIAEGGGNVSGGQKQRLCIARAIAKRPRIFLFDDSFSALDYKTDAALRSALKKELHDATVLIVAQRVSTILSAEQIIVLEEGRVVGIGNHQTLMETCPTYREIAVSQLSGEELGGVGA